MNQKVDHLWAALNQSFVRNRKNMAPTSSSQTLTVKAKHDARISSWKHLRRENRQFCNRILIYSLSELPSLDVQEAPQSIQDSSLCARGCGTIYSWYKKPQIWLCFASFGRFLRAEMLTIVHLPVVMTLAEGKQLEENVHCYKGNFRNKYWTKWCGKTGSVQYSWERAVWKMEEGLFVGESGATDWMGGVNWLGPREAEHRPITRKWQKS